MQDRIAVIGGTGLYQLDQLDIEEEREIHTPFGEPSAPILLGKLGENAVAFLPRHGSNHSLLPSEINYRANIYALKKLGAKSVVSVSATGSLEEAIRPGDISIPSQYFDWTRGRTSTFFGQGLIAHVSTAQPSCEKLSAALFIASQVAQVEVHRNKTYACVEGPRLGTQAESFFLQKAGCHLVGMTNLPEAFLAREAQMSYCTLAVATDYDCWKENPDEHVSVEKVIALYKETLGKVVKILEAFFSTKQDFSQDLPARKSLESAILTPLDQLDDDKRSLLEILRS